MIIQCERRAWDHLREIPLFENLFLYMQLTNAAIVNSYIEQLEDDLHRVYMETERTPAETIYVKAFSEFWIFGLYELLRNWHQRIQELLSYVKKLTKAEALTPEERKKLRPPQRSDFKHNLVDEMSEKAWYDSYFDKIDEDPSYAAQLKRALKLVEPAYEKVTRLRVALAKHEIPGQEPGRRRFIPMVARIGHDGSLYWFITLKDGTTDQISRRELWDLLTDIRFSPGSEAGESD